MPPIPDTTTPSPNVPYRRPSPPLKWHGGKHYLAEWIVGMMPAHLHYVEPYAGGLSVLLAKSPEGVSEVVNDIDGELTNFWRVMQVEKLFNEFLRIEQATPFSEAEYDWACRQPDKTKENPALAAHIFFVRCRQSLAGRRKSFSGITRTRTRRGMNNEVSAWLTAVEGLPLVHQRLKRVLVLNRDALDVIRQQDGPGTLFYLDPPYHPDTRAATSVYSYEMSASQHATLLNVLEGVKGKFLLSGYRCQTYDAAALRNGWHRQDRLIPNHAAGGSNKRVMTESVWTNYQVDLVKPVG